MNEKNWKAGFEAFLVLCGLLFIDMALTAMKIVWLPNPASIFVLIAAAITYYSVRLTILSAKDPDRFQKKGKVEWVIYLVAAVLLWIIVTADGGKFLMPTDREKFVIIACLVVMFLAVAASEIVKGKPNPAEDEKKPGGK